MRVKYGIAKAALVVLVVLAVGYLTAHASVPHCISSVQEELRNAPRVGYGIGPGTIVVGPESVTGRVTGPFRVKASYMVPHGLGGTIHTTSFLSLPWACKPQHATTVTLGSRLPANNSSKPTPLRGAA